MAKTLRKRRWLLQCDSEFLLRNSPRGRFLYDYVPLDATIPEMSSETFGEPFSAAKATSINRDDRHFMMAPCKRPAKCAQA
jgi:hypothetical protein